VIDRDNRIIEINLKKKKKRETHARIVDHAFSRNCETSGKLTNRCI